MSQHFLLALLAIVFLLFFAYGNAGAFFWLLFLGILLFLAATLLKGVISFLSEMVKTEGEELEKSSGQTPSGKDSQGIFEDAIGVLLNLNKPKGNITKRVGKVSKEFFEKGAKLFK